MINKTTIGITFAAGIIVGIFVYAKQTALIVDSEREVNDSQVTIDTSISEIPTPTNTPSPMPTKKVLSGASKTPTVTPQQAGCSRFEAKNGLATITISLKEVHGESLSGDWTVNIHSKLPCPAIFNGGSSVDGGLARNGQHTWTSNGIQPGTIRVDVNYKKTGKGFDVDATSGNHEFEVEVSNY